MPHGNRMDGVICPKEGDPVKKMIWLQASCCGGETTSLLNSDQPDILTTFKMLGIDIIWHPSFSLAQGSEVLELIEDYLLGKEPLDIFVVEGAVYANPLEDPKHLTPNGTHLDLVRKLSQSARHTLAMGTCASFGGLMSAGSNKMEAMGLQFYRTQSGGALGSDYRSRSGLPVVNVPGCPAHPDWMTGTLGAIVAGQLRSDDLDAYNRPKMFYSKLAHHGCPRNEYYEFKASAEEYGQQGCLFENLGCKGTLCESDCNERLWLARTGSCPRGGFPCLSCTSPVFPDGFMPFFETEKISDIPTTLPLDVPKAWYVGMSGLAKLACPERLRVNAVSCGQTDIKQKKENSQ